MRIGEEEVELGPIGLHELYLLKNLVADVGKRASKDPELRGDSGLWVLLEMLTEDEMAELLSIVTGLDRETVAKNFTLSWLGEIYEELGGLVGLGGLAGPGKGKENSQ